jgi:CheY-like chemotaxis protein
MPGILFADRDTQYASALRRWCEADRIPFFSHADGNSLISFAQSVHPGVILSSLQTGSPDEFECIERLRSDDEFKNVPCIIVTHLADQADIRQCRELGCSAYFIKRHTKPEHVFAYLERSGYLQSSVTAASVSSVYAVI